MGNLNVSKLFMTIVMDTRDWGFDSMHLNETESNIVDWIAKRVNRIAIG